MDEHDDWSTTWSAMCEDIIYCNLESRITLELVQLADAADVHKDRAAVYSSSCRRLKTIQLKKSLLVGKVTGHAQFVRADAQR